MREPGPAGSPRFGGHCASDLDSRSRSNFSSCPCYREARRKKSAGACGLFFWSQGPRLNPGLPRAAVFAGLEGARFRRAAQKPRTAALSHSDRETLIGANYRSTIVGCFHQPVGVDQGREKTRKQAIGAKKRRVRLRFLRNWRNYELAEVLFELRTVSFTVAIVVS
jgi:hypothetical protein